MADRSALPYGSWPSPITIEMAVTSQRTLREPRLFGSHAYWTEGRPEEQGRQVIVRWSEEDGVRDVTPPPFNARTMIHEYGGGWYTVDRASGTVYFSNVPDNRIYRLADRAPGPLTAEGPLRYGDLVMDSSRNRLICIREDHTGLTHDFAAPEGGRIAEPVNTLIAVDLGTGAESVLASGYDFYSTPRVSPDGARLAWLAWRHPHMPWDESELWVAEFDSDGSLVGERKVAGGTDESIVQPEWAPDGTLVFVSDRTGWWNLHRQDPEQPGEPIALAPMRAEFAGPQWVFGMCWYGIDADGTIYASGGGEDGDGGGIWVISATEPPRLLDVPDIRVESLQVYDGRLLYIGGSWAEPRRMVLFDLATNERRVLRDQFALEIGPAYLAEPQEIEFPTTGGQSAFGLYYAPTNPDFAGTTGEKPPLVVMSHGGPTSSATTALQLEIDAFTSRGFAVVDVNYRGSTGHGREYMRSLDGMWGINDVDDCIAAATYLVARGDADPDRLAIRGASAGGYSTLAALTFRDVFAAGASHYGVADVEGLARFTHKFESHYLDRLIAPYPDGVELYHERSPIYHVDRLRRPLIVLQGADDMVVPIAQAERMVEALRRRRVPHAYLVFEGEGHGFRRLENMKRALEGELSFYAQVFGFELADEFEPISVEYLPRLKRGMQPSA
ncbi:MAG TPA: S9 family peptidase [Candidatus Limnocylindrales bacterium]